ncbi:MAG: hypothetical protein VX278_14910 [Myxococcota bacterium]|nr:hypothetical protein [Myxococcota bacterium]
MISLLFSCLAPSPIEEEGCFTEAPDQHARIHRVSCSAEIVDESVRRGDFILENPHVRFVVREPSSALTDPVSMGGSLIYGGLEDLLFEFRPQPSDDRSVSTHLYTDTEEVSLSFFSEETFLFSYRLPQEGKTLFLEGFDDAILYPLPSTTLHHSSLFSSTFETGMQLFAEEIEDLSGAILLGDVHRIHFDRTERLYQSDDALWIEWTGEADLLEFRSPSASYTLPVHDGLASGYVPNNVSHWRSRGYGCNTSDWTPIEMTLDPQCGSTRFRAQDDNFDAMVFQISSQNHTFPVPKEGASVPIPPEEDTVFVNAGPAFEQQTVPNIDASLLLDRRIPKALLFEPVLRAPPDSEERRSAQDLLALAASRGVNYTVLAARNIVSPFDSAPEPHWQPFIESASGLQMIEDDRWLLVWPWEAQPRNPAYGALPPGVSAREQLALADRLDRTSLGSISWFHSLQEETQTEFPDFLYIESLADIPTVYQLLDQETPIRFLGPQNWIFGLENKRYPHSRVIRELFEQNLCFGNGPFVSLSITDDTLSVRADRPSWMNVDSLLIRGEGGEILQQWSFDELSIEKHVVLPSSRWLSAEVSGEYWAAHIVL